MSILKTQLLKTHLLKTQLLKTQLLEKGIIFTREGDYMVVSIFTRPFALYVFDSVLHFRQAQ
jgi:hypothetical protein